MNKALERILFAGLIIIVGILYTSVAYVAWHFITKYW